MSYEPQQSSRGIYTTDPKYGLVADVKTVTDAAMTAGSNLLASTQINSAVPAPKVGQLIVVNGAGTAVTATSSSLLSTGGPITTIPVSALAAVLGAGPITISSGGHTQTFQCTGAGVGATTLGIVSATPNFAYPSTSPITASYGAPLVTTITAVTTGQLTLAANAGTTVTAAETVFATNNLTGLQAAINDAITLRLPLMMVGSSIGGEGFGYSGLLTANGPLTIKGSINEVWGGYSGSNDFNRAAIPNLAPYVLGSVLVQFAANTDGIFNPTVGYSWTVRDFAIRFAGKWQSTGHGFNCSPPGADNGILSSDFQNVVVYGHDGNHFAFNMVSQMYVTTSHLRGYGGGGINLPVTSGFGVQMGNGVGTHSYFTLCAAGTAAGVFVNSNRQTMIGPQVWGWVSGQPMGGANVLLIGSQVPNPTQGNFKNSSGPNVVVVNPDMERAAAGLSADYTGLGGASAMYNGGAVVHSSTSVGSHWQDNPVSGTAYQNTTGTDVILNVTYDLTATGGAQAQVIVQACDQPGFGAPWVLAEETVPAATAGTWRRTCTVQVVSGSYLKITATNAALVRAFSYGVVGTF